jgi:hypothetical protein
MFGFFPAAHDFSTGSESHPTLSHPGNPVRSQYWKHKPKDIEEEGNVIVAMLDLVLPAKMVPWQ